MDTAERYPWKMPVGFGAYDLGQDRHGYPVRHLQFPETVGQRFDPPWRVLSLHVSDGLVCWKNYEFAPEVAVAGLRYAACAEEEDLAARLVPGLVVSAHAWVAWRTVHDLIAQLVLEAARERPDGLVLHLYTGPRADHEWRSLAGGLGARPVSSGDRVVDARVHLAVLDAAVGITVGEGGEAILIPVPRQPVVDETEMRKLNEAWVSVARHLRGVRSGADEHVRIDAEGGVPIAFVIQVAYYLLREGHGGLIIGQLRLSALR